jgi:hypothetical protein
MPKLPVVSGTSVAATSLMLAVGASLFFVLYPTVSESHGGEPRLVTLFETNDWQDVVTALSIPILLAASPFALRRTRYFRVTRLISAIGLTAFAVAGILTVGLFYFPSALAMYIAAYIKN